MTTVRDVSEPAVRSPKAEQTRRSIVQAAMQLFRVEGYDKTTMRAIAAEAGVSLGNAYYYFAGKEHLIQAYYDQVQEQHAAAAAEVLRSETVFAARLGGLYAAWVEVASPYHDFAGQFFKTAAEPSSPLSPFSAESAPARSASIALFREAVEGSDLKVGRALRGELPELLWLLQMGFVLFWVYDTSPDQRRTHELISRAVPLVDRLARLSRLPVLRGVIDDVVDLVRSLRTDTPAG